MPKTLEQVRIESAARVLAAHYPSHDRLVCLCGDEWHPQHQAEALAAAGCLGPRPEPKRPCGCSVSQSFLMCCAQVRDSLAEDDYRHSTRRAILGKEWSALKPDERAGWITRATDKMTGARATR